MPHIIKTWYTTSGKHWLLPSTIHRVLTSVAAKPAGALLALPLANTISTVWLVTDAQAAR